MLLEGCRVAVNELKLIAKLKRERLSGFKFNSRLMDLLEFERT